MSLISDWEKHLRNGVRLIVLCLIWREVPLKTIEEIREATNKSWVLGSEYFKEMIEDKINRPMNPRSRGGDRKSKSYKNNKNNINQV